MSDVVVRLGVDVGSVLSTTGRKFGGKCIWSQADPGGCAFMTLFGLEYGFLVLALVN